MKYNILIERKKWKKNETEVNQLIESRGVGASLWYDDKEKPIDEHTPGICIDGEVMNTPLLENPDFQEYLKTFKRLCEYK